MEWTDQAIVLASRRHGESSAVVQLLTRDHGRHAGLARGVSSKRNRAVAEPGNLVQAIWKARLSDHLGMLSLDPLHQTAAELMTTPRRLAGLASACAIAEAALPEREPHPALFDATSALFQVMEADDGEGVIWPAAYVKWELGVLSELGFGLDLTKCAATGETGGLAYVSPRSARAVSTEAGEPYKDRLLTLPRFLVDSVPAGNQSIVDGLALTGFFLQRHVFDAVHKATPAARDRFAVMFDSVELSPESSSVP
jgi:DNA repair protein RecO (recombination protein O)